MVHDTTQPAREHLLADYLFDDAPSHLLIVGDLPRSLRSRTADGVSIHTLATLEEAENLTTQLENDAEQSGDITRVLVLEVDPGETQFEQYLGRAVRAFPQRVLLHCATSDVSPGRADDAFFAFGFRKLALVPDTSSPHTVVKWFEYRLSQYKPAPDWLNARYWANPDRFDKDEDPDDDYEDSDEEE